MSNKYTLTDNALCAWIKIHIVVYTLKLNIRKRLKKFYIKLFN